MRSHTVWLWLNILKCFIFFFGSAFILILHFVLSLIILLLIVLLLVFTLIILPFLFRSHKLMQSRMYLFLSIHHLILIIVFNYCYWWSTWALSGIFAGGLSFAFGLLIVHFVLAARSFLSLMNRPISTANFTRLPNSLGNFLRDRGKLGLAYSLWWAWDKRLYRLLRGGELPNGPNGWLMPSRLLLRLLSWPICLRSIIIKRQCGLESFFVEIWNLVLSLHLIWL